MRIRAPAAPPGYAQHLADPIASHPGTHAPLHEGRAAARKPHAIDDGLILGQAKEPRARISLLRHGCNRANLNMPKAECRKAAHSAGVLVVTRSEADRVLELQPEGRHGC